MHISDSLWSALVYVTNIVTLWSFEADSVPQQHPLTDPLDHSPNLLPVNIAPLYDNKDGPGPTFPPHSGAPGSRFVCDYSNMPGYKNCTTAGDSGCWLRRASDGYEYNITTDYEKIAPRGILRKYTIEAVDQPIIADGKPNPGGKVFRVVDGIPGNEKMVTHCQNYPGPWIQACWGDELEITVINKLNKTPVLHSNETGQGLTVHWHGIRQKDTSEMDGVNGVTQCPVAPGQSFTYRFKALQYGSTWYHSHYSLQYADGLAGPMTIHGPASAEYDEVFPEPLLMTDWNHQSAFTDWDESLRNGKRPTMTNILLNGMGEYPRKCAEGNKTCLPTPPYKMVFKKGKRYLLRLINTSVDTTFVFSIDNHKITVMSSDFVPIKPYVTDSVLVGIGQRYHVIINAHPTKESTNNAYWIRTTPAKDCGGFKSGPEERTGRLCYNEPCTASPTTTKGVFPIECSDEPYQSLIPVLPWKVGPPENNAGNSQFEISLEPQPNVNMTPGSVFYPSCKPGQKDCIRKWNMHSDTLWLNYSDPTLMNLDKDPKILPSNWVVVNHEHPAESWIYLLITAGGMPRDGRIFPAAAHPIHLHGHDFALLQQSNKPYKFGSLNLNTNNPPRRDVVLLPANGFIVIAFKADNPGVWLMHCHIAWHASGGLGLQILENRNSIAINSYAKMDDTCKAWIKWNQCKDPLKNEVGNCKILQDDSGI